MQYTPLINLATFLQTEVKPIAITIAIATTNSESFD